ncbi:hypothetical protein RIF29_00637 [Crotalaria pallida]|uniref:Uncharacterized protein n=1 Tax=Crotalaria pallida TaxID=3830 RepID=A0AAN9IVV1_CROPI
MATAYVSIDPHCHPNPWPSSMNSDYNMMVKYLRLRIRLCPSRGLFGILGTTTFYVHNLLRPQPPHI